MNISRRNGAISLSVSRKAQYERHLAKWGFRKNLTRSDWVRAGRVIKERTREGKVSELLVNEEVVSWKKLKKGLYRYARDIDAELPQQGRTSDPV
jgi:hypothetical protein